MIDKEKEEEEIKEEGIGEWDEEDEIEKIGDIYDKL